MFDGQAGLHKSAIVIAIDARIHIVVMFDQDGSVQIDCNAIVCRPLAGT